MRILGLFDKYFLILMLIQGSVLSSIDYAKFKKLNKNKLAMKSRLIGIVVILISIILYLITKFLY
ncbi:CLC_0170 family protein [Clostridium sp. JN-1]|jgi:hypothetical protein|uniref:CLC_0170 family protein n=1 Tax=Clostridium sp. JN-1 TaxID=2483110 RepID=UPI001681622D|nr:CLC_0170 family protein [Clostridium sp. JN-1]